VHCFICIECVHMICHDGLCSRLREVNQRCFDADAFTGFDFISHIDIACIIVPHHHYSEMGSVFEFFDGFSDFLCERICQFFDIEDHLTKDSSKSWYGYDHEHIEYENQYQWCEIDHAYSRRKHFSC